MKKLSAEMQKCLDALDKHGKLVRYRGGFWSMENAPMKTTDPWPEWYFGTTTIEALIRRDLVQVTGTKMGHYGTFPIEIQLTFKQNQHA